MKRLVEVGGGTKSDKGEASDGAVAKSMMILKQVLRSEEPDMTQWMVVCERW